MKIPVNGQRANISSGAQDDAGSETERAARHSAAAPPPEEHAGKKERHLTATEGDTPGGERTATQDADAATEESVRRRVGEEEMWEQQGAGEVEQERETTAPDPLNPDAGRPEPVREAGTGEGAVTNEGGQSDPVTALQEEVQALETQLRQLAADFENYKRQAARREQEARERATMTVLEDLLPVLDNFERAVEAASVGSDLESIRVGVAYILQQFEEAMRTHGVEAIEAHGQPFDPLHHDAVEQVEGSGENAGTVVEQSQRGYTYHGKLLRPSRVKVAA